MTTFASLFTGMGGADIGAKMAGLTPIWGVEINPAIANLAQSNFPESLIVRGDVGRFAYTEWERPDWLHASPPCVNASRAKNGKETDMDRYLAEGVCQAIAVLEPEYFSLENVAGYAQFDSFSSIKQLLKSLNYNVDYQIIDCVRYGIPQNRKRLFLVAGKRGAFYEFPVIKTSPNVSWKEAIADLIPILEPTNLTGWQKEALIHRFPGTRFYFDYCGTLPILAVQRSGARKRHGIPNNTIRLAHQPMFTIKAMSGKVRPNANQVTLLIDGVPYKADSQCLARWQSIPDSYQFSGNLILDTMAIGNAVPPLMFKKIIASTLES